MAGMNTPLSVRTAVAAWTTAVAAGVAESVLVVTQLAGEHQFGAGQLADVALRVVVYSAAMTLVVLLARRHQWARVALTVLLTGIGLASLVVPAAMSMVDGQTFVQAFSDGGHLGAAFVTVRLLHIACVVTASVAMYLPSANRHFARPAVARQQRVLSAAAR